LTQSLCGFCRNQLLRASFLVEPFLYVLKSVPQVDLGATQLEVNETVPNLLRLLERELPLAISSIGVMGRVLEHVVVPKDRVLHEVLIGKSTHCPTILIVGEFQHIPLDFEVDVVVEESLTTEIASNQDF